MTYDAWRIGFLLKLLFKPEPGLANSALITDYSFLQDPRFFQNSCRF